MLKRLWARYTDFITLDWLLRLTGNNERLQLAIVLLAYSVPLGCWGWKWLQPGHVEHNRYLVPLTRGQTVFWGCLSVILAVALAGLALYVICGEIRRRKQRRRS